MNTNNNNLEDIEKADSSNQTFNQEKNPNTVIDSNRILQPYPGIHTSTGADHLLHRSRDYRGQQLTKNKETKSQKDSTTLHTTKYTHNPYNFEDIYLFECSWEVCNKVGGIYTVVTTKMPFMQTIFQDRYFLIGPYEGGHANPEFLQKAPPSHLQSIFDELMTIGISCYYGTWISGTNPQVILIDCKNYTYANNDIKKGLWEKYGIDSLGSDFFDFDKPMLWSWCAGILIERFAKQNNVRVIAQLHEWLAGAAALYLNNAFPKYETLTIEKNNNSVSHKYDSRQVVSVFTTHATVLGRCLASSSDLFYEELDKYDAQRAEEVAQQRGVKTKHQLEKYSAIHADIFTTVSEITANEAYHFLGKKADIITYNGMFLPQIHDDNAGIVRRSAKASIFELAMSAFMPQKEIDPENTTIFATFGRYEFHVKGLDVVSKAMGLLNARLGKESSSKKAICLFCIPAGVYGIRQELLVSKAKYMDIKTSIFQHRDGLLFSLTHDIIESPDVPISHLIDPTLATELALKIKNFKSPVPTIHTTHYLQDQEHDPLMKAFYAEGLGNTVADHVNVLFIPVYLTGHDGILDLTYHETIQGIDLGLFPSFYEPWGYTPFETASYGIPAITTDAAGFGSFVKNTCPDQKGVIVLARQRRSMQDTAESLAEELYEFIHLTKEEKLERRKLAREVGEKADWSNFAAKYIEGYGRALGLKRIK